jgi:hypothetical protein
MMRLTRDETLENDEALDTFWEAALSCSLLLLEAGTQDRQTHHREKKSKNGGGRNIYRLCIQMEAPRRLVLIGQEGTP